MRDNAREDALIRMLDTSRVKLFPVARAKRFAAWAHVEEKRKFHRGLADYASTKFDTVPLRGGRGR